MSGKPFLDTNVILYAFTSNDPRQEKALALLAVGGTISVQVLNEFVNLAAKFAVGGQKLKRLSER